MNLPELANRVLEALEQRGLSAASVRHRIAQGEQLESIIRDAGLTLREVELHRPYWPDFVAFHIHPGV